MFSLQEDRTMNVIRVVLLLAILMNNQKVHSEIVQGPSDTTAMVNESTYFNCSTSIRPVEDSSVTWFHYPLDRGGDREYVYDDGRIFPDYKNRFAIDIDLSSGKFNLLALSLETKDAGKYKCSDDRPLHGDEGASAELTVLESPLDCESDMDPDGVVGPAQCHTPIAPDELQLSCSVTYNGRNAPQMIWRNAGDSSTINKTDCVNKDNRVTCNASLTADLQLNRSVYYCELTTTQKYNHCSLEIPNILYVFSGNETVNITTNEEVKCFANNSSQSCSYKWKWFNESDSLTVSTNQTLKPTRVGSHRCEATCYIGNKRCTVDVMFAEVYSTQSSEATTGRVLWPIFLSIAIGLIMMLCVIILTIIIVVYQMKKGTWNIHPILRFVCQHCAYWNVALNLQSEEIQDLSRLLKHGNKDEMELSSLKKKLVEFKGHIEQNRIEDNREFLEKNMDPDSGLLEALSAKGYLSKQEINDVLEKNPFRKRNSRLLDFILKKRQFHRLLEALRDTEQLHIAYYLNAKGEYSREYGGEWPLTPKEISILNDNEKALVDELDLTDLPGRLYFAKVINKRQMNNISSKPTSSALLDDLQRRSKAQALLDILRRRSRRDFRKTIFCLRESGQNHLAELLETVSEGGADPGDIQIEIPAEPQFDDPPAKYDYYPCIVGEIKREAENEANENEGSMITGMTILDEELFIVSESSSEVEVYNATTFTPIRKWKTGVTDPGGIESCKNKKCLYIVGWKTSGRSRTILRVDPQGKRITDWSIPDSWSYLSVTDNSNVILTVPEETKLIEYSPNGNVIRKIKLSSDACRFIKNLWRSVKLSSGNFVVCFGLEDDDLHGLLIVNKHKQIENLFDRTKDFNLGKLRQPVHLVVDKDDFILVADSKNSRVLLFDSNLEYQKELLFDENSELQHPSILYLDESKGLLYVVKNYPDGRRSIGQVLIFRIESTRS